MHPTRNWSLRYIRRRCVDIFTQASLQRACLLCSSAAASRFARSGNGSRRHETNAVRRRTGEKDNHVRRSVSPDQGSDWRVWDPGMLARAGRRRFLRHSDDCLTLRRVCERTFECRFVSCASGITSQVLKTMRAIPEIIGVEKIFSGGEQWIFLGVAKRIFSVGRKRWLNSFHQLETKRTTFLTKSPIGKY